MKIFILFLLNFIFYKDKTKQTGKQSSSVLYSTKMDYTDASKTSIGFEILF